MFNFFKEFRPHVVSYNRTSFNRTTCGSRVETVYVVARRRLRDLGYKMYWNGGHWHVVPPLSSENVSVSIEDAIEKFHNVDNGTGFVGFVKDLDNG